MANQGDVNIIQFQIFSGLSPLPFMGTAVWVEHSNSQQAQDLKSHTAARGTWEQPVQSWPSRQSLIKS